MHASDYWQFFLETGAPEYYLMYQRALKMEGNHGLIGLLLYIHVLDSKSS